MRREFAVEAEQLLLLLREFLRVVGSAMGLEQLPGLPIGSDLRPSEGLTRSIPRGRSGLERGEKRRTEMSTLLRLAGNMAGSGNDEH